MICVASSWRERVALHYASIGVAVFPSGLDRRPRIRGWVANATTDQAVIHRWWRQWPDAVICGATGVARGVVVLDLDRKGAKNALAELRERGWLLPQTWTARTPSGGLHVYFRPFSAPGGVIRCATEMLGRGRSGVDLRGDGGSITLPTPRTGWRWTTWRPGRCDLAAAPGWLVRMVHDRQRPPPPIAPASRPDGYADAAIGRALHEIETVTQGSRQATLARVAWRIGRLASEHGVPAGDALQAVLRATEAIGGPDWDRRSAEQTARRCFAHGYGHGHG